MEQQLKSLLVQSRDSMRQLKCELRDLNLRLDHLLNRLRERL